MTAFARIESNNEHGSLVWELRSVNHRYLDVSLRLADDLRSIEQTVRENLAATLGRGKIDCNLRFKANAQVVNDLYINNEYVQKLTTVCRQLSAQLENPAAVSPLELLRMPGVLKELERDNSVLEQAALNSLKLALEELIATREREGGRIADMLLQRCALIAEIVKNVQARRSDVMQAIREKLQTRIADLGVNADPGRLEQELVIIAQRMDVSEELDRLESHIKEVRDVLKRDEPVGRRLDFLMQELNREANTLGSKSADAETTRAAVDLKVMIEQMREQVQNIE
ncbi:MAG: YicC family protein [Gammaproteobacteria bacterium]|nr:YicC family protein [Gammaproteobacteria bacterium]